MAGGQSVEKAVNSAADVVEASWPKIRRDFEALGRDLRQAGEKHLNGTQDAVADELGKLRDGLTDLLNELTDRAQPQVDSALDMVRRRPVTVLAGVFAVGLITAALFSRKSS